MAKDLNNAVKVTNGDMGEIIKALDAGNTVICALEKGPMVTKLLEDNHSDYMNADCELVEEGGNYGTCGCGKPANVLVALWR